VAEIASIISSRDNTTTNTLITIANSTENQIQMLFSKNKIRIASVKYISGISILFIVLFFLSFILLDINRLFKLKYLYKKFINYFTKHPKLNLIDVKQIDQVFRFI
jgi:hypothetical protein